jgi:hypothetical protein
MRTDHPAASAWLDQTAQRCANALNLRPVQLGQLRELLAAAVSDFPDEALEADMLEGMYGFLARTRRQSMSPESWDFWQKATRIYRRAGRPALELPGAAREEWQSTALAWFESASGTTLLQPVRLLKKQGRPRDMVVSTVEIVCDRGETEGYAVLNAVVYRPPRTSPCQIFTPGDELRRLDWNDLPFRARQDSELPT